jgi:hypothetical protein
MLMLELLIALAVFALSTGATALLFGMDVHAAADLAGEREAREAVSETLERARAGGNAATASVSPCLMEAAASAAYRRSGGRTGTTSAGTLVADFEEFTRRGMDCEIVPAPSAGTLTKRGSVGISTTTAIDVLGDTAYVGLADPPYLAVVEGADGTVPNIRAAFLNGFALPAAPNALDAIAVADAAGKRHRYVYAALDATSSQLAAVDVTDPAAPVLTASATLRNVDPDGEEPAGWRILYYDRNLYVATRYTAGRELHVFDATDPATPAELGGGTELGITANGLAMRQAGGSRYLFIASARDGGEAAAYDATDPQMLGSVAELPAARTDLPGGQDGLSLALLGTRLYLGRAANAGGGELVVLDVSAPMDGLPVLGSASAGSSVTDMRAWDGRLVIRTGKDGGTVDLWDVAGAASPARMASAKAAGSGIDLAGATAFAPAKGALVRFSLSP